MLRCLRMPARPAARISAFPSRSALDAVVDASVVRVKRDEHGLPGSEESEDSAVTGVQTSMSSNVRCEGGSVNGNAVRYPSGIRGDGLGAAGGEAAVGAFPSCSLRVCHV